MKLITVSSEFFERPTSFDLNPAPVIVVIVILISLGICCRRRSPVVTVVTSELVSVPSRNRMQIGHADFLSSDGSSPV